MLDVDELFPCEENKVMFEVGSLEEFHVLIKIFPLVVIQQEKKTNIKQNTILKFWVFPKHSVHVS